MTKYLVPLGGIVIVVLAAALGYFIYQNQKIIKNLPAASQAPVSSPSSVVAQNIPTPSSSPKLTKEDIYAQIEASLNSKNYQALSTYMSTPKVNFIIMSSECCQPQTSDEAVKQLEYVKGGEPFDVNQQSDKIKTLKTKNSRLTNAFIALSKSGEQMAAFTLDANNKITTIEVAITYKLYDL